VVCRSITSLTLEFVRLRGYERSNYESEREKIYSAYELSKYRYSLNAMVLVLYSPNIRNPGFSSHIPIVHF